MQEAAFSLACLGKPREGLQRQGSTRWGPRKHRGATHHPAAALPPALPSAFDCLHRRLVAGLADTLGTRLPAVAHLRGCGVGGESSGA